MKQLPKTSRMPNKTEMRIALETLQRHLKRFAEDQDAAKALIAYGESKPDSSLNASELAAYAMLANLLLNLDETITKNQSQAE